MSERQPKILRPPSYWADYHYRRRERAERGARAAVTRPTEVALLGCQNHGVAWTFTHHRTTPLLTVIQNDGRLLTVPTGPLDPSPPPPPVKWAPKPALAVRPSPDEVLLVRLVQSCGDGPSALERKVDTTKVPKRKATAEDTSSGKHTKRAPLRPRLKHIKDERWLRGRKMTPANPIRMYTGEHEPGGGGGGMQVGADIEGGEDGGGEERESTAIGGGQDTPAVTVMKGLQ
ncbi:hypothetical protein B0H14DRAFT_2605678 [Mycena olivaceomarginata]|nr:hypothetical protein B0H14DRAFT_2605678 [Mycena olivaceomarginata]